jgi:hypothetical protein
MHRLLLGGVSRKVNVVEMSGVPKGIDNHKRTLQRLGVQPDRYAREIGRLRDGELEGTPRSGEGLAALRHVENGRTVVIQNLPIRTVRNSPLEAEYVQGVGSRQSDSGGEQKTQPFVHAYMLTCEHLRRDSGREL